MRRHTGLTGQYEAPVGEVELTLAEVWSELLGIDKVGRGDNFFALGGNSLLGLVVSDRIRQRGLSLDMGALFAAPTLAALAAALSGGAEAHEVIVPPNLILAGCNAITPEMLPLVALTQDEIDQIVAAVPGGAANVQDIYPLAPLQEAVLFQHLLAKDISRCLVRRIMRFETQTDLQAHLAALQAAVDRHDALRTAVVWDGLRVPVQVVWRTAVLPVEQVVIELGTSDEVGGSAEELYSRLNFRKEPWDVRQAPMLRACVIHVVADGANSARWLLLYLQHLLVGGRTTLEVLDAELGAHLTGRVRTPAEPLPFRNLVALARLGVSGAEHERYFRALLGDVTEPTQPFGAVDIHRGASGTRQAQQVVDAGLVRRLSAGARALGVSVPSVCHVAFACVLARVSGRGEVVFGTVLGGLSEGGTAANGIAGLCINTLPVRIQTDHGGVAASVRKTHGLLADLVRHRYASPVLAQSCSRIAPPTPLFLALLHYRHGAGGPPTESRQSWVGDRRLIWEEWVNYPMSLTMDDLSGELKIGAQVAEAARVDPDRVCQWMHTALERLVDALERAPETALRELDVLPPEERRQVIEEWNATEAPYPSDKCVHELFELQVARTPDAVAVAFEDEQLMYRELNQRANRLARTLTERGVGHGQYVPILMERSIAVVVAMLAVMKTGAAFVPLDWRWPQQRVIGVLSELRAPVLVCDRPELIEAALDHEQIVKIGEFAVPASQDGVQNLCVPVARGDPIYAIFTSGSTGRPKAAVVLHGGVANRLHWMNGYFGSPEAVLQTTSHVHDSAVWQIFWPLMNGGRTVSIREAVLADAEELTGCVARHGITITDFVPSVASILVGQLGRDPTLCKRLAPLRWIVLGGERIMPETVHRLSGLLPGVRVVNLYGPTEATIGCIAHEVTRGDADRIPIGLPIANTWAVVLDGFGRPTPVGVAGELFLGGACLGLGYLHDEPRTRTAFVQNPFRELPGAQMYRTGDICRRRADGALEIFGRLDDQVKIRGYRIELGEIEAVVGTHPGVQTAVVVVREDERGEKQLVTYYVAAQPGDAVVGDAALEPEVLRSYLGERLPSYMMPAAYVRLNAVPLTPNGKVDRKALPAPDDSAYARWGYEAPIGPVEKAVAEIWSELLGIEAVSRWDDFFAVGGHSLIAIQIISRLRTRFRVDLPIHAVFLARSLAALSKEAEMAIYKNIASMSDADAERILESIAS